MFTYFQVKIGKFFINLLTSNFIPAKTESLSLFIKVRSINSAICGMISSLTPLVVNAGVPILIPEVTIVICHQMAPCFYLP